MTKRLCPECGGRKYCIADRDDGYVAIERCDACSWHGDSHPSTISDMGAAKLAAMAGVACVTDDYPCYVLGADLAPKRWLRSIEDAASELGIAHGVELPELVFGYQDGRITYDVVNRRR